MLIKNLGRHTTTAHRSAHTPPPLPVRQPLLNLPLGKIPQPPNPEPPNPNPHPQTLTPNPKAAARARRRLAVDRPAHQPPELEKIAG
jgi:hypothetical protein